MKYTDFDPNIWGNQSFVKIGYDKNAKQLCIFFHNQRVVYFDQVEEKTVFQFIISTDKEAFLKDIFWREYEHRWLTSSLLAQTP
ncbi:KTSC domain-containing protein [Halobacillus sp. MO56]